MKSKHMILPLMLALASAPLYAGHGHGNGHHRKQRSDDSVVVRARVISVQPLIEYLPLPHEIRRCRDEALQRTPTSHSGGGALVGAIIGGVIGHNVCSPHNRGVTTAVGTMIGAGIGHQADRVHHSPYRYTERHCEILTEYSEQPQLTGYRVHYRYRGEDFESVMDHDPGRFVPLRARYRMLD